MTSSAPLKDSVPPHNNEAEVATLGAILLNNEALGRVVAHIRARDFYRNAHREIFEAIVQLSERGEEIDLITLTQELRSLGKLEAVGGAGYVSSLTSAVPTSANVEYYAKIVREMSVRRLLITISHEMIATAHNDSHSSREILEEAEKRIFDIAGEQHSASFRQAREIVEETVEAIERLYRNKESYTGVPSGFSELDNMLSGFQNSEFVIVGARPSVGKTALALTMAGNIAVHHQIPVGFFTLEMSSMQIMQRLIASEARISSQAIRAGMLRPSDFRSIADAAGLIYEAPLWITDTPNMALLDLRAQARRMVSQHGVKILFIDYLTLISSENPELPRHEQMAEVSRSLKALARELGIPVIALSQLTRDSEGRRPTLANIRESGSIEQDADVVIFLHRERGSERTGEEHPSIVETELIVAKQRNGPVGTVHIAFVPKYTRFDEMTQQAV